MPTIEYLTFGTGGNANVISQNSYVAGAWRTNGFSSGIASSNQLNKVWRQSSVAAAAVATFIANRTGDDVLDNGDEGALATLIEKAVRKAGAIEETINTETHAYTLAQSGQINNRSNTGNSNAMVDALPGKDDPGGMMTAGTITQIVNGDASKLLAVGPGTGSTFKYHFSTAWVMLAPGQACALYSDGTDYWVLAAPDRVKLRANTTLYVTAGGNNNDAGVTAATAWATMQSAWDTVLRTFDLNGFTITIDVADGAFTDALVAIGPIPGGRALAPVIFEGNTGSPQNVTITTNDDCIQAVNGAAIEIKGFELSSTSGSCVSARRAGLVRISSIRYANASASHMAARAGGVVDVVGNYTINGNAAAHFRPSINSTIRVSAGSPTITLTGTPAFSGAFALAEGVSIIHAQNITFSGAATGSRYKSNENSVIDSGGGGGTYFPGDAGGTTNNGGVYV